MKTNITLEQSLSKASPQLRKKIQASVDLLQKSESLALKYDANNGFYLAFSCGKDSQALYHVAELANVKFKAHFSPTTADPPQVIRFCKTHYPEVEIIKPKTSIYKQAVDMACLPTMRIRWCCAVFKEGHGAGTVTLTGVRHSESARRSKRKEVEVSGHKFSGNLDEFNAYSEKRIKKIFKNLNQDQFGEVKENEVRCIGGKDKIIVNPIIDWTESDVWEFLNNVMEVPHCELYDPPYNRKRIGCIMCPMSSQKALIQDCKDYPHIKYKWLKVIKLIRGGDVGWRAFGTSLLQQVGGGIGEYYPGMGEPIHTQCNGTIKNTRAYGENTPFCPCPTDDGAKEDWIAEKIFEWWISKKNYRQWFAEEFIQQKFDFGD